MNSSLTMLVIEDDEQHVAEFKAMFARLQPNLPVQIEVTCATTLSEAMNLIPSADMVLSDVFFPETFGGDIGPCGEVIVGMCLNAKKPVVLCTSTYHHGKETNDVSQTCRGFGLEMFDCYVEEGQTEAPHKPWLEAFYGLIVLMLGLEDGTYAIEGGCLMGPKPPRPETWNPTCSRSLLGGAINQVAYDFTLTHKPMVRKLVDMGFPR